MFDRYLCLSASVQPPPTSLRTQMVRSRRLARPPNTGSVWVYHLTQHIPWRMWPRKDWIIHTRCRCVCLRIGPSRSNCLSARRVSGPAVWRGCEAHHELQRRGTRRCFCRSMCLCWANDSTSIAMSFGSRKTCLIPISSAAARIRLTGRIMVNVITHLTGFIHSNLFDLQTLVWTGRR